MGVLEELRVKAAALQREVAMALREAKRQQDRQGLMLKDKNVEVAELSALADATERAAIVKAGRVSKKTRKSKKASSRKKSKSKAKVGAGLAIKRKAKKRRAKSKAKKLVGMNLINKSPKPKRVRRKNRSKKLSKKTVLNRGRSVRRKSGFSKKMVKRRRMRKAA